MNIQKPRIAVAQPHERNAAGFKAHPTVVKRFNDGIQAWYNTESQNIKIAMVDRGDDIDLVCRVLSHEVLHHILYEEVGWGASEALDNIDGRGNSLIE